MSLFQRKTTENKAPAPVPFRPGEIEIIGEDRPPSDETKALPAAGQGPLIRGQRRSIPPRSRPISWREANEGPEGAGPLQPLKPKSDKEQVPAADEIPDEPVRPLRPAAGNGPGPARLPAELTEEIDEALAQEAEPATERDLDDQTAELITQAEREEPEVVQEAAPLRVSGPSTPEEEEAERIRRREVRRQRQAERQRREEEERQKRLRSQNRRQQRAERIRKWRAERKARRERKLQARAEEMLRATPGQKSSSWRDRLPAWSRKGERRPRQEPEFLRRIRAQLRQRQARRARERWSDVVGLDIGASTIRAAFFANGQAMLFEKKIPEGIIVDGFLSEPEELSEELRSMWAEGGIPSNKVNFSISNRLVAVRAISLPAEYEEDIEQALALNAAPIVSPMNPDQTIIDYAELSRVGPQVSLQVAAADIEMSRGYLDAVEAAGLIAASAEVGSLASSRAIVIPRSTQQTHGVIDIGAELTTVSIASGPDTFFFRTIESGGNDFTRSLFPLGLTWSEAERAKVASGIGRRPADRGLDRDDFALLRPAMQPVADNLCQEILQTQELYERSESGRQKPIFSYTIIGGGSKLEGLAEQISSATGRPCEDAVRPWPGLEAIEVDFALWAPALGLGRSNSMSLLPPAGGLFSRNRRRHSKISPRTAQHRAREMSSSANKPAVSVRMIAVLLALVALLGMFLWGRSIRSSTEEINREAAAASRTAQGLEESSGSRLAKKISAEVAAKPDWGRVADLARPIDFRSIQTSGSEVRLTGPNRETGKLPKGVSIRPINRSLAETTIRSRP